MRIASIFVILLCALSWRVEAKTPEQLVDGVPLPADVSPAPANSSQFAGTWIGTWDGRLKTILVVESVTKGQARVVYAVADSPGRFERAWFRYDAEIAGDVLTVFGKRSEIQFTLSGSGRLRAVFGSGFGFAVLSRMDLKSLTEPGVTIPWTIGSSEFLATDLVENNKPVDLEAVIFKPPGVGPFPLAVVNHGSTGRGTDAAVAKATWINPWFADVLNEKGWIVAFPQRRGRGKSDGVYDEGIAEDRSKGYTCNTRRSLAGAERALDDLRAAIVTLRKRPEIADAPVLLAGNSRGGALSVAYAGKYSGDTLGVINFVGGWMGDGCKTASTINQTLFNKGSAFKEPTLWLYGKSDVYYAMAHSRQNFDEFRNNGGLGRFEEMTVAGKNNGHWVMSVPPLWSQAVDAYLDAQHWSKVNILDREL